MICEEEAGTEECENSCHAPYTRMHLCARIELSEERYSEEDGENIMDKIACLGMEEKTNHEAGECAEECEHGCAFS